MADDTPSSDGLKHTPKSDEISSSAPSAPSDFLPHLPSSSDKAFGDRDESPEATNGGTSTVTGPPKVQVDSQGRTLNPRSCVTCRKRKVRRQLDKALHLEARANLVVFACAGQMRQNASVRQLQSSAYRMCIPSARESCKEGEEARRRKGQGAARAVAEAGGCCEGHGS